MYYNRKGLPEESELVLCTVTKIHFTSVFATLDEYNGKTGMIHISEISPGRIRTISDYVKEGKKIICKVIRVNQERGHIDLSLRRVNEGQRREKNELIKKELKAEKIVDFAAQELKLQPKKFYQEVFAKIEPMYPYMHQCFEEIVTKQFDIKKLKLDPKTEEVLHTLITQRMKPPEVEIKGVLTLESYEPDGVKKLVDVFKKMSHENIEIKYTGAGKYSVLIKAKDYDFAEEIFEKHIEKQVEAFKKEGGKAEFART
ncbi:S1 RNA-binding domain-containing protein [Candidatus Woesearchaeota archaeon]|nr:S1 RNA-binding domain-containing protein [Candidatus Woesearchaeota archaeon]MBW3014613.1 S1 RNA-binding domain-containing protein [Candidatus Woesearchaeota archaeon]